MSPKVHLRNIIKFGIPVLAVSVACTLFVAVRNEPNTFHCVKNKWIQEITRRQLDQARRLRIDRRYDQAIVMVQNILESRRRAFGSQNASYLEALNELARLLADNDEQEKADAALRDAQVIGNSLVGKDSLEFANTLTRLGDRAESNKDYKEASIEYSKALEIRTSVVGPNSLPVASSLVDLSELQRLQNDYSGSKKNSLRALAIAEANPIADKTLKSRVFYSQAKLYEATRQYEDAINLIDRVIEIDSRLYPSNHPELSIDLALRGNLLIDTDQYMEAEHTFTTVVGMDEKWFGANDATLADDLDDLARASLLANHFDIADNALKREMQIDPDTYGQSSVDVSTDLNRLADLYRIMGRYEDGIRLDLQALELDQNRPDRDDADIGEDTYYLRELYLNDAKYADAEKYIFQTINVEKKAYAPEHEQIAIDLRLLATLYINEGRLDLALREAQKAQRMDRKLNLSAASDEDVLLIANILTEKGQDRRALRLLKGKLARDSQSNPYLNQCEEHNDLSNIALVLERVGDFKSAENYLTDSINAAFRPRLKPYIY
jgi:tetratricopeptide (TPR) repeat protein